MTDPDLDSAPDRALERAVTAVTAALSALHRDPHSPRVSAALHHAGDAVAVLPTDLTSVVLRRLVLAITDCHHDGVTHSTRLAVCLRSTAIARHLDPRWADTHTIPATGPGPSPTSPLLAEASYGGGTTPHAPADHDRLIWTHTGPTTTHHHGPRPSPGQRAVVPSS